VQGVEQGRPSTEPQTRLMRSNLTLRYDAVLDGFRAFNILLNIYECNTENLHVHWRLMVFAIFQFPVFYCYVVLFGRLVKSTPLLW